MINREYIGKISHDWEIFGKPTSQFWKNIGIVIYLMKKKQFLPNAGNLFPSISQLWDLVVLESQYKTIPVNKLGMLSQLIHIFGDLLGNYSQRNLNKTPVTGNNDQPPPNKKLHNFEI